MCESNHSKSLRRVLALLVTVALTGCGTSADTRKFNRTLVEMEKWIEILEGVVDEPTALATAPELGPASSRFIEQNLILIEAAGNDAQVMISEKDKKGLLDRKGQLFQRAQAESKRLGGLTGLPSEFWDVLRTESLRMMITEAEAGLKQGVKLNYDSYSRLREEWYLYEKHGADSVVELTFQEFPFASELKSIEAWCELILPNASVLISRDDRVAHGTRLTIAPVTDLDGLINLIEFATVERKDPGRRWVVLNAHPECQEIVQRSMLEVEWSRREEQGGDQFLVWLVDRVIMDRRYAYLQFDLSPYLEKADSILDRTDPASIANPEVREKIVAHYKQRMQYTGGPRSGVRPSYARWAGPEGYVDVVAYCDRNQEGYRALAKFGTKEAAEYLVDKVGERSYRSGEFPLALTALGTMGSLAEQPVLDGLSEGKINVDMATLIVLGRIGTDKSVPFLQTVPESVLVKQALEDIEQRGGKPVAPEEQ